MITYGTYKDSGISWLRQIPSHWKVKRTRIVLSENAVANSDVKITKQLQFKYGEIVPKANQALDDGVKETISKYTIVNEGDIMINGLNLNYDFISQRVAQVQEQGCITSAYISLRPTDLAHSRFYTYFLKAMDNIKMFHGMGSGVRLTLSYNELRNMYIPIPPIYEQLAIAKYIDDAIAEINAAISQQQKMIELLKERKQIIINEAVTRGLNPDVPMQETGIEWLPQIPAHWEMRKISSIYLPNIGSGTTPMTGNNKYYVDDGINWLQSGDLNGSFVYETAKKISESAMKDYGLKLYPKGSLVIAMYGASIGNLGLLQIETTVNQACCVLCPTDKIIQEYAFFSFVCSKAHLINLSSGGGQPNISQEKIKAHKIPFPPIDEQSSIVSYIVASTNPINFAIAHSERMIELLKERKQIVINDVVTGKIKVI